MMLTSQKDKMISQARLKKWIAGLLQDDDLSLSEIKEIRRLVQQAVEKKTLVKKGQ